MKIWIDAQLSPAIAAWINRTYEDIEAQSVRAIGLRNALIPKYLKKLESRM